MTTPPTILADGILDASVMHGVARLTLAQAGPDGKPVPVGQLAVPLSQLPSILRTLGGMVQQVEERLRQQQPAAPAEAAPAAPANGAFRFG
jgi:hypothetical protein